MHRLASPRNCDFRCHLRGRKARWVSAIGFRGFRLRRPGDRNGRRTDHLGGRVACRELRLHLLNRERARAGMFGSSAHAEPRGQKLADAPALDLVARSAAVFALHPRLRDPLGLTLTALLIVLPGYRGHHVEHHSVDGVQHPLGELVAWGAPHRDVACRQIDSDDPQPLGLDLGSEPAPVGRRQTRQPIDRLHKQNVTSLGIGQEPAELGAVGGGAGGVLHVSAGDLLPMSRRERREQSLARLAS
jgi:hypothetical protein